VTVIPNRTGLVAVLVLVTLLGCRRSAPVVTEAPTLAWQDTWPVLVLTDPHLPQHLDPLDAVSGLWLISPARSDAAPWPDAWTLPTHLGAETPAAQLSLARATAAAAGAWRTLAQLDAEALCQLGRSPAAYGDEVPVGYLYGVEGCLWAGDLEGARAAWANYGAAAGAERIDWPAVPDELPAAAELAARALPHGGHAPGAPPGRAHATFYRSREQSVEYAFVLPGDLFAAAADLEERAGEIDACEIDAAEALPLLVADSPLSHAQRCGEARGEAPPVFEAGGASPISDLDGAVEAYLDGYLAAVEAGAAADGSLPLEALPSIREMARRGVYRRVGLDAAAGGDNATALWALETAAGADWSTASRGANDPEMICSLALARFRAGRYRPVVQSLDDLGAAPGWSALRDLARTVARVDAMPGADSVGVMR